MSSAYFTYGRFQPPHRGHQRVLDTIKEHAARDGADNFVFYSHTRDNDNPLSPQDKMRFLETMFPENYVVSVQEKIYNPYHAMRVLDGGYQHVKMFVGEDRVDAFEGIKRYMNHPTKGYSFETFEIVNVGSRLNEDDDISLMSGTRARTLAHEGKLEEFAHMIPSSDLNLVEELYYSLRKSNISESQSMRGLINLI